MLMYIVYWCNGIHVILTIDTCLQNFSKPQLLFAVLIVGVSNAYQNSYDGELLFECMSNDQTISLIQSTHSNSAEDRVFELECKNIDLDTEPLDTPVCSWASKFKYLKCF